MFTQTFCWQAETSVTASLANRLPVYVQSYKFELETFTMEYAIVSPAPCRGGRAEFWDSNLVQNTFS